jgi:hypothetical protein
MTRKVVLRGAFAALSVLVGVYCILGYVMSAALSAPGHERRLAAEIYAVLTACAFLVAIVFATTAWRARGRT